MVEARSCGLLCLIGFAASRFAEHVRAQVVTGYQSTCSLFNFYAVFSRNYAEGTIKPIPDMRLPDSNQLSQSSLSAGYFNCFL